MTVLETILQNQKLTKKQIKKIDFKVTEPKNIQIEYYKALKSIANQLKNDINEKLIPVLMNTQPITTTNDSINEILATLSFLQSKYANIFAFGMGIAERVVGAINRYNKSKFNSKAQSQIGVNLDLILSENNIREMLQLETARQVSLIKSIPTEFLKDIEMIVTNGFSQGLRHEEIARQIKGIKDISSTFGKLDNRVKFIARNEIGSINANLNKIRQQNAGVDFYEWSTSEDERVRISHRVLNGKICKWSDVTVYADSLEDAQNGKWKKRSSIGAVEKIAGADYNCRCVGLAVIPFE